MKLALISFTDKGVLLAASLAGKLTAQGHTVTCREPGVPLKDWTAQFFPTSDGLIFIGASGIAVRAIAPHMQDKARDPAVVVMDEGGKFAVSLLSGHLGGANALAEELAKLTGAVPVITTATDSRGLFAVDSWAKRQGCFVREPERIKGVSARILAGQTVSVYSEIPITGEPPEGVVLSPGPAQVEVTVRPQGNALHIIPPVGVLGVGCKKGTSAENLEAALRALDIAPQAICKVCSINLKAHEPGLLAFCQAHGWELQTFPAADLAAVSGDFTPSPFVAQVTGVDNVCERAAMLGSGGVLYLKKQAGNGVTIALVLKPYTMDWSW